MTIVELKKKTIEELKVIAYDQQGAINGLTQSLRMVEELINEKQNERRESQPQDQKQDPSTTKSDGKAK